MTKIFVLLTLFTFSSFCFGSTKPSFCSERKSASTFRELLRSPANLLPMKNTGGMLGLNTGVCWWHSRLQRRFSYLAHFRPELPRPSLKQVKKIIRLIKKKENIVVIPGFKNLDEFGRAYGKEIQKSLNAWMLGDSALRQTWIKGLKKKKIKTHQEFQTYLESLYREFKSNNGLLFQILNFKGVSAHAWLITDIQKDDRGEFIFEIVDSNRPQSPIRFIPDFMKMNPDSSKTIRYTSYNEDVNANPYKHPLFKYDDFFSISFFQKEETNLKKALSAYCAL